MGILDALRGAARVGGAGFAGYADDQRTNAAAVLAQTKAKQDAERDKVLNALTTAQTNRAMAPAPQALTTGRGPDGNPVRVVDAPGVEVYEAPKAPSLITGEGGVRVADVPGAKAYIAPEKPKEPELIPVPNKDGSGSTLTPKTPGLVIPAVAGAPKPPRAPSGEQEKSAMFYRMMEGATPDIDNSLASGKVDGDKISVALSIPGVFNPLTMRGLNAEEQVYLRGLRAFSAGQLRRETGAAFGNKELLDVHQRLFEGGGDTDELKQSKRAARASAMATMKQSALPALLYYESVNKNGLPSVDAAADAADPGGGNVPGPGSPPGASSPKPSISQKEYQALLGMGKTEQAIRAKFTITP